MKLIMAVEDTSYTHTKKAGIELRDLTKSR